MDRRNPHDEPLTGSRVAAVPSAVSARGDWVRLVIANLSRMILVSCLGLAMWSSLPRVIGWEPTTVVSGSMAPRIQVGDVVVARPAQDAQLSAGQVLLVDDPDRVGELRLHRLVERNDAGDLVLRGDANGHDDSTPVDPGAVHGVAVLRIPWTGLPGRWVAERDWLRLGVLTAALVLAMVGCGRDRVLRRREPPAGPPPAPTSDPRRAPAGRQKPMLPGLARSATPALRPVLAGLVAGLALVGMGTVSPAGAALTTRTSNSGLTLNTLRYYTCGAAVAAGSPYLYYRFDETNPGSTTAIDSSASNLDGTFEGTGVSRGQARACPRDTGSAVTLGGTTTTGYVSSSGSSNPGPETFTIQIWFKTTSAAGMLIGFGSSRTGASKKSDRTLYIASTGKVVFGVYPTAYKTVTSTTTVTDGTWHLATASLSTGGMKLYLDGELEATDSTTTSAEGSKGWWRVGYDDLTGWPTPPSSPYVKATVDDAAVFTSELSAVTVRDIWAASR